MELPHPSSAERAAEQLGEGRSLSAATGHQYRDLEGG